MRAARERFVIHLPVVTRDLLSAVRLARVVARWASVLAQTGPGETTVSAEDAQHLRHRVFCDTLLPTAGAACSGPTTTAPAPAVRRDSEIFGRDLSGTGPPVRHPGENPTPRSTE
jgi:hypothetical protein